MNDKELADLASRWDGVTKGHTRLTFEGAQADMQALLAEVRKAAELKRRIAELEAHVRKRNNDMQAFAAEVARLANQKYADYMQ
jgi:Tfp pilus assembly protein FimV